MVTVFDPRNVPMLLLHEQARANCKRNLHALGQCQKPEGHHWPGKKRRDRANDKFFQAAKDGCVTCVRRELEETKSVAPDVQSDNHEWTVRDFTHWEVKENPGKQSVKDLDEFWWHIPLGAPVHGSVVTRRCGNSDSRSRDAPLWQLRLASGTVSARLPRARATIHRAAVRGGVSQKNCSQMFARGLCRFSAGPLGNEGYKRLHDGPIQGITMAAGQCFLRHGDRQGLRESPGTTRECQGQQSTTDRQAYFRGRHHNFVYHDCH